MLHRLGEPLDARMPRAVSIDVDLSLAPPNHRFVLFLALVGSTVDKCTVVPVGLPAAGPVTPDQLALAWPHAALLMVELI
jgi:hypothetical protein